MRNSNLFQDYKHDHASKSWHEEHIKRANSNIVIQLQLLQLEDLFVLDLL